MRQYCFALDLKEDENLMLQFQQALPWAKPNEKWVLMNKIYQLV